jgi:hypothetical protein
MRYRTKPVEIEAVQWLGDNLDEIADFVGDDPRVRFNEFGLYIFTLEGRMYATVGDYIIRGLRGEYYPCKPDVFVKKYEEVR